LRFSHFYNHIFAWHFKRSCAANRAKALFKPFKNAESLVVSMFQKLGIFEFELFNDDDTIGQVKVDGVIEA